MNINFEELKKIPEIMKIIVCIKEVVEKGNIEKRWLNTRELAQYTGYKFETIQSKIKKREFIQGIHYFKKGGILLFDKIEVDNWVMGIRPFNEVSDKKNPSEQAEEVYGGILKMLK